MLDWVGRHSDTLSVLINLGILSVWLFYAQVLLSSFLRQRKPRVLVTQGRGQDLDARIMVSNMSREPILLLCLQAVVETDTDCFVRTITDVQTHDPGDPAGETRLVASQGPLGTGSYMRLGTFRQLADWVSPECEDQGAWRSIVIRVIFLYSSENQPICAYRQFHLTDGDGRRRVRPTTLDTPEMRSRRHRRRIQDWLADSV